MKYEDFRTGLSFAEVRAMLVGEQKAARDKGLYMFVSRATVMGRWH